MKKLLLILPLLIFSCKTRNAVEQKTITPPKVKIDTSTKDFFDEIAKENNYQQVKINSVINVQTGSFIPSLDATIYIEKDQKIWLNVSALFFNVARGMATPNGIKGYEKWNKTYIESDFEYINKLLNVSFINYTSLQNLLTGRVFFPINPQDFRFEKNQNRVSLKSNKNQIIEVNGKIVQYQVSVDFSDNNLYRLIINEVGGKINQLSVFYENWVEMGKTRFPKNVKIIIKGEKDGQVLIENTKFDFQKMETPYSVPSNYQKVNIK